MNRFKVGDILVRSRGGSAYLNRGDIVEATYVRKADGALMVRRVGTAHYTKDISNVWFEAGYFDLAESHNEPM